MNSKICELHEQLSTISKELEDWLDSSDIVSALMIPQENMRFQWLSIGTNTSYIQLIIVYFGEAYNVRVEFDHRARTRSITVECDGCE